MTPPQDPSRVFPEARAALDAVDDAAPGLIRDVYLTGSIALGDGRPGQSDIDVVLVRDDDATHAAAMAALEPAMAMLRKTHPRPMVDGIVLSRADLAAGPDALDGPRPVIFDNAVNLETGGSARNPVTWHTLRQSGVTWRGTPIVDIPLWQDPNRLRSWVQDNLHSYWCPWLTSTERLPSRDGWNELLPELTEWGVLGVTRLHYTLTTGRITSKRGAGTYALETFPEHWHRIVREAIRLRERRPDDAMYRPDDALRQLGDAQRYVDMVIGDARALPAGP